MLATKQAQTPATDLVAWRRPCRGALPLDAFVEEWMADFFSDDRLPGLIKEHGSPLNLISTASMRSNLDQLNQVSAERNLDFKVFFARKSNKCLAFVDQANRCGAGIDTASENEIQQAIDQGVEASQIICTAAVKNDSLIQRCLKNSICIAVDNRDELHVIVDHANKLACQAIVALRLGGFRHEGQKLPTRFGFDVDRDNTLLAELSDLPLSVQGIHFHLDGYDARQRVTGIAQSLKWIQALRDLGHSPAFIDIGGGFPISYLRSAQQWDTFWQEHEKALLGQRESVTYRNHHLGRQQTEGKIFGKPNSYPYYQTPVRADWLASVLDAKIDGQTVATKLRNSHIQLRCEPGRSLMDGCGMTVAKVEFRKQNAEGDWLIGLSMNRTQCRTSSDDFLVDPILLPTGEGTSDPMTGFLVGAYCTESELLSLRRLRFPNGVRRGDLVVFPNTAGYFMHFLESRSHQFPLAKNVVVSDTGEPIALDLIDV